MPSQATRPPLVGMPAVWLRDNCPCPLCRDPVSGQRLLHITDIPADIAVAEVVASGGTVSVLFHPDGHRAVFDRDWLARRAGPSPGRSLPRTTRPPDPGPATASCGPASRPAGRASPAWRGPGREPGLRPGDQLRPAVRRPGRELAVQPGLHQPAHPPAHGQPVPRPGADRATAALPAQRGRGWRLRVRGRIPRRRRAPRAGSGRVRHARRHPGHLRIPRRRHGAVRHPPADQPGRPWADPGDPDQPAQSPARPATRTGFAQAGRRHLQGCYADLDGVESAVAVGERATTGVIRRKDRI